MHSNRINLVCSSRAAMKDWEWWETFFMRNVYFHMLNLSAQWCKANGSLQKNHHSPVLTPLASSINFSKCVVRNTKLYSALFHPALCFLNLHYPHILHNHCKITQIFNFVIISMWVKYCVIAWLPYWCTVPLSQYSSVGIKNFFYASLASLVYMHEHSVMSDFIGCLLWYSLMNLNSFYISWILTKFFTILLMEDTMP